MSGVIMAILMSAPIGLDNNVRESEVMTIGGCDIRALFLNHYNMDRIYWCEEMK